MTATRAAPVAVAAGALALAPVQLGLVPGLEHAWGMTLWRYLPSPVAALLGAGLVLACSGAVRRRLIATAARAHGLVPRAVVLAAVPIVLWLLRERRLYGDSAILLLNAAGGSNFIFPDIGATFLFHACMRLAPLLGVPGQAVVQAAVALAGGVALATFLAAARLLAPSPGRAVLLTALVLGAGLTRVLAGHVEVYGFLLATTGTWLWAAAAHLRGRVGLWAPAAATGLVAWMHLSGIFLVPGLVVLALEDTRARRLRRVVLALAIAAAPGLAFFAVMLLAGRLADVEQAVSTMLHWTGVVPSPTGHEAFLRLPPAAPGIGTRYVVFSPAHWKYLTNAFFLLAPAAFPLLGVVALWRPSALWATPERRMLSVTLLSLLVYTVLVRPVWGPYDWDLFSLTAAVAGTLAALLLVTSAPRAVALDLGSLIVVATAMLVTVPLLVVGIVPVDDVGPFGVARLEGRPGETPEDTLIRHVGPWL